MHRVTVSYGWVYTLCKWQKGAITPLALKKRSLPQSHALMDRLISKTLVAMLTNSCNNPSHWLIYLEGWIWLTDTWDSFYQGRDWTTYLISVIWAPHSVLLQWQEGKTELVDCFLLQAPFTTISFTATFFQPPLLQPPSTFELLFSYASSSTLYPCQSVAGWAEQRLASLLLFTPTATAPHWPAVLQHFENF